MANVLVLYHSVTDCTAQMARYVADGAASIKGMDVRLVELGAATAEDVVWGDGIAVGCPTQIGTASWQMKRFFDETLVDQWAKIDGKFGCAFSSSGGWGGGAELTCQTITNMLINYGFLVFGVVEYVTQTHTLHYGAVTAKAPRDEASQQACFKLGVRLGEWLGVYVDRDADLHPLATRVSALPSS